MFQSKFENRKSKIKISCIIPTLNRADILLRTVGRLLRQTWPPHQIIIVDQSPLPQFRELKQRLTHLQSQISNFRAQIPPVPPHVAKSQIPIIALHQTQPNASQARNTAALAASGNVLLFLDDDILLTTRLLQHYAHTFERTADPAVAGPILEHHRQRVHHLPRRAADPSDLGWLLHFPKNYAAESRTSFMMSGNLAIQRHLYLQLGGMDQHFHRGAYREESDFAFRFRQAGYRVRFNPRCAIYHLGAGRVPFGGARNWHHGADFRYFHHCVGDWYFNLKHGRMAARAVPLVWHSLRYFVLNRRRLRQPHRLLAALLYWLAALPVATGRLLRGPLYLPEGAQKQGLKTAGPAEGPSVAGGG